MSYVTNVILTWSGEATELRPVNEFFETRDCRGFMDVSANESFWERGKRLECEVAVGAFNYLPMRNFVDHIRALDWEEPEHVRLHVCDQEDMAFSIWNPFDEDWYRAWSAEHEAEDES